MSTRVPGRVPNNFKLQESRLWCEVHGYHSPPITVDCVFYPGPGTRFSTRVPVPVAEGPTADGPRPFTGIRGTRVSQMQKF
eukprot:3912312-Rhodomonas_salina.1